MEIIKLEKRKKIIKWKTIFRTGVVLIIVIAGLIFGSQFRKGTEYLMYRGGEYVSIGVAKNNNLVDIALMEELNGIRAEGFQIVDYNLEQYIKEKSTISKKKSFKKNSKIKDLIKDNIYVIVNLVQVDIDGDTYFFRDEAAASHFISTIREKNEDIKYEKSNVYANIKKITTEKDLKAAINKYTE